jgi:hypothetical protein
MYILSISDHKVVLSWGGWNDRIQRVIDSVEDYEEFMSIQGEDARVACSSSIDYPEDETTNEKTINLARALREVF